MNTNEAIKILKEGTVNGKRLYRSTIPYGEQKPIMTGYDRAVDTLEEEIKKHNPVQFRRMPFGNEMMVICPTCNYAMIKSRGDFMAMYCSCCGQEFINGYLKFYDEPMPKKKSIIHNLLSIFGVE